MQIVVLLAFLISLTMLEYPPVCGPDARLLAFAVSYYVVVAAVLSRLGGPVRGDGAIEPSSIRRRGILRAAGRFWLVGGLAGLMAIGWGWWVAEGLGLDRLPLVGKLVVLAPFFLTLLANWWFEYPLHRAMQLHAIAGGGTPRPAWTRGQYISYNARHNLLFIALPVCLIILGIDCLTLYAGPHLPAAFRQKALSACTLVWSGAVFITSPLIIALVLRTRPLQAGPLRDELEQMCRDLRLRYRDIVVWPSGGLVANAGVMGLIGLARYIMMSDGLLEQFNARQIRAIFGHEAGHIVNHHIAYFLMFAVGAGVTSVLGGNLAAAALGGADGVAELASLALLLLAWVAVFGWVSRRFERQCDVMGAWAADPPQQPGETRITPEGAAIFSMALQRVAMLNGSPLAQRRWRHGSITWRVSYILWLGGNGGGRRDIGRLVRLIKAAILAVFIASVALAAWEAVTS